MRNLQKLHTLFLPRHTHLVNTTPGENDAEPATIKWPPELQELQISGTFDEDSLIALPAQLTTLILENCDNLCSLSMAHLLQSVRRAAHLHSLHVSHLNGYLEPDSILSIAYFLPNLTTLTVPGDLVYDEFFNVLANESQSPHMNLHVLELDLPYDVAFLGFSFRSLITALPTGLARLRSVVLAGCFALAGSIEELDQLDEALKRRAADDADPYSYDDYGVYYM